MSNPVYELSPERNETIGQISERILSFARIGVAAADSNMNVKLNSGDIQALLETIAKDANRISELAE